LERIKNDLTELREDVGLVLERKKEVKFANKKSEEDALRDIELMQEQILELANNEGFKEIVDNTSGEILTLENHLTLLKSKLQGQLGETLLSKLKALKDSNDNEKNVSFKLFVDKKTTSLKNEIKLEELDSRLANLEKALGNSKSNNLLDQLDKVQRTVEFINDSKLESIAKKVTTVNQELETLNNKRQALNLTDPNFMKLEALHEMYTKVQNVNEELPSIIERLECLKLIHEESAYLTDKINGLKEMQTTILSNLSENNKILKNVEDNFEKNVTLIDSNMKNLEERINKLSK